MAVIECEVRLFKINQPDEREHVCRCVTHSLACFRKARSHASNKLAWVSRNLKTIVGRPRFPSPIEILESTTTTQKLHELDKEMLRAEH